MKPFLVGGIEMQYPIIVGAGACKYPAQLNQYLRDDLPIGAITLGSITPNASLGNEGNLFFPDSWTEFQELQAGLNSFGMPNDGYEKSCLGLPNDSPIPIIASIAAFSIEDFLPGIRHFDEHPVIRAIKLNISCPNKGKLPIGFDIDALDQLIRNIRELSPRCPIWIKTPRYVTKEILASFAEKHPEFDFSATPTIDDNFLRAFGQLIGENSDIIHALVVGNTLGNVVRRHPNGATVTTPNGGQAGLSGPIVREISIDLLMRLTGLFGHTVDFIGSGGILTGDDAMEYLRHEDITAVCCTSGPFWYGDGPRFFADLLAESEQLQNHLIQRPQ
jgi:dihydroorotate dehydrogenase (NAD+) catalytic subunit